MVISRLFWFLLWQGKNPEDVVRRYTEKIKVVPDEVRKTKKFGCPPADALCRSLMSLTTCESFTSNSRWSISVGLFQDCTICMERLVMSSGYEGVLQHKGIKPELVGKLGKCGHMYHLLCLVAMYNNGNKVGKGSWARRCYDVTAGSNYKPATSAVMGRADDRASVSAWTDGDLIVWSDLSNRYKRCIQPGLFAWKHT